MICRGYSTPMTKYISSRHWMACATSISPLIMVMPSIIMDALLARRGVCIVEADDRKWVGWFLCKWEVCKGKKMSICTVKNQHIPCLNNREYNSVSHSQKYCKPLVLDNSQKASGLRFPICTYFLSEISHKKCVKLRIKTGNQWQLWLASR